MSAARLPLSSFPTGLALLLTLAPSPIALAQSAPLLGIEAARDHGPIVTWSASELFVGDHDGISFRALPIAGVIDVAIASDGAMLVSRLLQSPTQSSRSDPGEPPPLGPGCNASCVEWYLARSVPPSSVLE